MHLQRGLRITVPHCFCDRNMIDTGIDRLDLRRYRQQPEPVCLVEEIPCHARKVAVTIRIKGRDKKPLFDGVI